jgi:hypothetical protein
MPDQAPALLDVNGNPVTAAPDRLDVNGNPIPTRDANTLSTFVKHYVNQLNPVQLGQLLPWPKTAGGAGWDAPVQAAKNMLDAQNALKAKADAAYATGDKTQALIHYFHWMLPVIGPVLDQAGEDFRAGRYASSLGDTAGVATAWAAPEAAARLRASGPAAAVAGRAAAAADTRVADVMGPKGSSRAIQQLGRQAADVAEDVRQGTTAITPSGLHGQVLNRLADASAALDEAYGTMPTTAYSTQPLLAKLTAARDALKVHGTGGSMTPAAERARAAALDQAIAEVQQIGPYTNTQNLAQLRNSWKTPASAAFVPEINPNFQEIRQSAKGWADAWSALQDTLTDRHPELKPLNADYHVWKQAADVMDALADQQRVKPTIGRTLMARAGGGAVGAALGGGAGAGVGQVVGPLVERGLTQTVAPATKLFIARRLGGLADALRSQQPTPIETVLKELRPLLLINAAKPGPFATLPTSLDDAWPVGVPGRE